MAISLKPLDDRVVVQPMEAEERTARRDRPAGRRQGKAAARQGHRRRPGPAARQRRTLRGLGRRR